MKNLKFLMLLFIPLHLLGLSMFWITEVSYLHLFYFVVGYILIGGLGTEVGLHRWASHKSVELRTYAKPVVLFLSLLSCQGHPIWWATVHRGYHHRKTDTPQDIHSPVEHGYFHAFIGWILHHNISDINFKYSVDLIRDKMLHTTHRFYEVIIITTWVAVAFISVDFLLWAIILPTIISFHSEGLINTLCHSRIGYRNFNTEDKSTNILFLGWLVWGNGWHNNHHHDPKSFDFGKSVSGKWWEIDPTRIFLPLIKNNVR
jgi:stearoyl-CoA desaturase (delta-9 desaturase)